MLQIISGRSAVKAGVSLVTLITSLSSSNLIKYSLSFVGLIYPTPTQLLPYLNPTPASTLTPTPTPAPTGLPNTICEEAFIFF